MYMFSVPAEYYYHYFVATQLTAKGSADDLHGSPPCSACMNAHVTSRSTGTEHIRGLVVDKYHKGASIVLGNVTGLKFVLSIGDICAIKVVCIN
jgi:hypothetical protein